MRILFLANDDEGLYKFRKELIKKLLKDNEVFISLPYGRYVDDLVGFGCKFIETNFNRKGTNPIKDMALVSNYVKMIKEVKPDAVFTYTIKPNVYGGIACELTNTKYIANITGGLGSYERKDLIQVVALTLYKIAFRKVSKVFFQNTANRDYMLSKNIVNKDRCDLLPGSGVNLEDYKVLEYLDNDSVDFVYIGRIMAEKGFNQYIEAAEYIREKYPFTKFHVCGGYEDDYKDKVEELVNKGTIIYHGSVKNMVEIYQMIHCTIHPTYYPEGLSNVLLESSASGRPIITTNRPGCKEVIDDGINGYIVNQKDTNDLIEKIEKFLSLTFEQKKQMGLNGRKKVEKEFNRNIVINKYLEAIKQ